MLKTRLYSEVVNNRLDEITNLRRRKLAGEAVDLFVPTGLRDWDAVGGIPYNVLTVLGAGTGEGKSIVKLHCARAAAKSGLKVLIVDQEDPAARTADRSLAGVSGIDSKHIGLVELNDDEMARLAVAAMDVDEWGGNVYHYSGLVTPNEAKELWAAHPDAALVITDYLQALITPKGLGKEEAIRTLTQDMQLDAQDETHHVKRAHFALSQLTGEVEKTGDARLEYSRRKGTPDISGYRPGPGPGHMAWATAIAQHAKLLGYWWRPGRWERRAGISGARDNRGELLFPKVSFAGEGRIKIGFDGPTATLSDWKD